MPYTELEMLCKFGTFYWHLESLDVGNIQQINNCLPFGFSCSVCFWNQLKTDVCAVLLFALVSIHLLIFMTSPNCRIHRVWSLSVLFKEPYIASVYVVQLYMWQKGWVWQAFCFIKFCVYMKCVFECRIYFNLQWNYSPISI